MCAQRIIHQVSGKAVVGERLGAGAELRETDLYNAPNGDWLRCPSPGTTLEAGCKTAWVRPAKIVEESDRVDYGGRHATVETIDSRSVHIRYDGDAAKKTVAVPRQCFTSNWNTVKKEWWFT